MKNTVLRKTVIFVLAGIAVLGSLAGCGGAGSLENASAESAAPAGEESQQLQTIRVGIMTGQPDQYAILIGTEEGIFEKYGLSVETSEYAVGINTVDAIVNGNADTGLLADFAAVNRLGNTLHNTNLNLFAELGMSTANSVGIYVAPEYAEDPSSLDQSAGWITNIGTVSEYYTWQAQTYLGLNPDTQNLVNTDSTQTALAAATNGDATAAVQTGATATRFEEIGWVKIASPEDFGYQVGTYLVTTDEFLDNNVDLLADYLTALDESMQFINENLDDSAKRISEKFGIGEDDFKANWNQYNLIIGSTEEGAEHLEEVGEWAFSQGKYEEDYNIRDFIRTEAIEKAFPERVTVKK